MPKTVKRSIKAGTSTAEPVEFHVVPEGERWNVERNETFTGSFAYDANMAIGLAIAAAQRELTEASVCIQQADGHCQHVWP